MIRIGVIGYGYWGPNLVRNLAETDGAAVSANRSTKSRVSRQMPLQRASTSRPSWTTWPSRLEMTRVRGSWVETARGLLVYRVGADADDGSPAGPRLRALQVLAPTDWNFHAQGVLAEALQPVSHEQALDEPPRLPWHARAVGDAAAVT